MTVDLSLLAAPDAVEPLDFEATLEAITDDLVARHPPAADVIGYESEPLLAICQTITYSKVNDRARINDAAKSQMLAYAIRADLDQHGANVDLQRLPGEDDTRFRQRIQQAFHLLAAAGPASAYKQHALAVSTMVKDVDVFSEAPGQVTVCILAAELRPRAELSANDNAIATALFGETDDATNRYALAPVGGPLLRQVLAALNAEEVRPLTDAVVVRPPAVQLFAVEAVLEILPGPDPETLRTRRLAAAKAYLQSVTRIRYDVTRAGLIAALTESGIKDVRLASPAANIVRANGQLAVCTGIALTTEIVDA